MKKRMLSLLMVAILVLGVPATVFADPSSPPYPNNPMCISAPLPVCDIDEDSCP